ncbi:ABC transporter ATP-binding protein [Marinifilum sp. JC120]|nr:ABC transporter ATP-binding protein [Marinifilum sp. JC120]
MGIEVDNLFFGYEAGEEVLKGISFEFAEGEVVALLGHNGSGKSTLVKHFNGLLCPLRGSVKVNGVLSTDKKISELAGMVSMLFQNPDDQICKSSVWDEVAFGPENLGYEHGRIRELVKYYLSAFGLFELKKRNPYDLGLSERKRLAIASTLAMDTEIVVLDEPTAGLDPREIHMLESELEKLRSVGRTVVLISHDMDFVAENCSRAVCLQNGIKQFDGLIGDLFDNSALLEQCGLLAPQIVQLGSHYGLQLDEISPQGFINKILN